MYKFVCMVVVLSLFLLGVLQLKKKAQRVKVREIANSLVLQTNLHALSNFNQDRHQQVSNLLSARTRLDTSSLSLQKYHFMHGYTSASFSLTNSNFERLHVLLHSTGGWKFPVQIVSMSLQTNR